MFMQRHKYLLEKMLRWFVMGARNWLNKQTSIIFSFLKYKFLNLNRYICMKPIEMLKEIKNLLGVELSEQAVEEVQEVALAQMKLDNGTVLEAEAFEAGNEVFIVTEDERVAVPIGEYALEDGKILKVEEEGIIAEISEVAEEAPDEESPEVEVEVEAEELAEDKYATKEELAEIKSMIEEIKEMMKPKEEMSEEVKEESEELKEELSKPAAEPLKHSPEAKSQKEYKKFSSNRPQTTLDRVFQKLNNR